MKCYFDWSAVYSALVVILQVFVCEVALCGKFYHPHCIAKEIASSKGDERPLAKRIQSGEETFTCPMHTCKKCGKCEDKEDETEELRLAKCRRCPATWHVKCLPECVQTFFDDAFFWCSTTQHLQIISEVEVLESIENLPVKKCRKDLLFTGYLYL